MGDDEIKIIITEEEKKEKLFSCWDRLADHPATDRKRSRLKRTGPQTVKKVSKSWLFLIYWY